MRANRASHRHVDYAVAPFRALSVILPVSGTETTGFRRYADTLTFKLCDYLLTSGKESVVLRIAGQRRSASNGPMDKAAGVADLNLKSHLAPRAARAP
jgi:hypothetical protein